MEWFQPPTLRFFSLTGGDDVPVKADPQRVYLGFTVGVGTSTVNVFPATMGSTLRGFVVAQNDPREFFHAWHGPLVNMEWHAFASPGAILTIVELALRAWPGADEGAP
jgi:hypothetical protein